MSIRIDDIVADFTANSTAGEIKLHDWISEGNAILLSHSKKKDSK